MMLKAAMVKRALWVSLSGFRLGLEIFVVIFNLCIRLDQHDLAMSPALGYKQFLRSGSLGLTLKVNYHV